MVQPSFEGIVSRDEYFLKVYSNEQVLPVHALIVFKNFCCLVDEKIRPKVLACSSEITY